MKRMIILVVLVLALSAPLVARADLQNVQVGGEIRLRGNYVDGTLAGPGPFDVRYPASDVRGRPMGQFTPPPFQSAGPNAVYSYLSWNEKSNTTQFVEQRTRLHVKADFTDNVIAFIEFDNYNVWGEDFRSNYLTGVDSRPSSGQMSVPMLGPSGSVSVYQAYVEARELYGAPVTLRIGRQELSFGSEFLVGKGDKAPLFRGLSFDAVRLTYATDKLSVDAWASKLFEGSPAEEDGDVDFYGVYGTCKAIENVTFDLYWLYLRDARALPSDPAAPRHVTGFDSAYDPTELHTVGARSAGKFGAFDFEAEVAYQFGQVDQAGIMFKPGFYGDHDAEASVWAGKLEAGYTFDCAWKPRLFAGGVYFGGEDNRAISAHDKTAYLYPQSSISFNRLFSNQIYSGFVDLNDDLSNAYDARIGVVAAPLEKLTALLCVSYFGAVDTFDMPVAGECHTVTKGSSHYLGTEAYLALWYQYSKDLQ
ncbi:MAG: alginate export family protein, partial [Candidatus Hydrogenedentes bacterium]|nr:alginate export family protein [Candidatus Hydrogenedentota bacterium]